MEKDLLKSIEEAALKGIAASVDDALEINRLYSTDEICDAANRVREARVGSVIDTCSIVNARSGRCSEDCKWCSQSRFHATGIAEYEIVEHREFEQLLEVASSRGVGRFSLVTSGRKVAPGDIQRFCALYREAASKSDISLCASMGLLNKDELRQLKEAGVTRYHCNLETSSDYFPRLCSTHSHEDKLATIRAARELGMEVCSGGIIGMGEDMRQRLTMAQEAREAGATSIPVNILNPIPGTPLEGTPLISEDEVIRTVALMRLIAPDCTLRFAGGRSRLSPEANQRILRGGMNGALVGDMLTTVGNNIDQDYHLFASEGFTLPREDTK